MSQAFTYLNKNRERDKKTSFLFVMYAWHVNVENTVEEWKIRKNRVVSPTNYLGSYIGTPSMATKFPRVWHNADNLQRISIWNYRKSSTTFTRTQDRKYNCNTHKDSTCRWYRDEEFWGRARHPSPSDGATDPNESPARSRALASSIRVRSFRFERTVSIYFAQNFTFHGYMTKVL